MPSSTSNTSASEKLTWWFDHHRKRVSVAQDEAHFRRDTQRPQVSRSELQVLHQVHRACDAAPSSTAPMPDLDELIYWADIIDGAQFPDAKTAVELKEPAMRLMLVIEASHEPRTDPQDHSRDPATSRWPR